jgi:hypothetical protein
MKMKKGDPKMEDKLQRLSKESFLGELELTEKQKFKMANEVKDQTKQKTRPNLAWFNTSLSLIICTFLLFGTGFIAYKTIDGTDMEGNSTTVLSEVQGSGFAYSEYFKVVDELDERKDGTYYKPLFPTELMKVIPASMADGVHLIETDKIPFNVNEKTAYLVSSKNKNGNKQHELQFTYLNKSANGLANEFFIVSVTKVEENPLTKYDFSKETSDTMGNELRREVLKDDIPIFHQIRTTDSALIYSYYGYDEEEEKVITMATAANELYGYYNGYLYHVGYLINGAKNSKGIQEKILQLTREFILGKAGEDS